MSKCNEYNNAISFKMMMRKSLMLTKLYAAWNTVDEYKDLFNRFVKYEILRAKLD